MTPLPRQSDGSVRLASTSELVAYWHEHSDVNPHDLEMAIPAAIDALYTNRDAGGNMHSAGAAAAVAALEVTLNA